MRRPLRLLLAALPLALAGACTPAALAAPATTLDLGGAPVTGGTANVPARFVAASTDAATVAFSTAEPLVPTDADGKTDLYVRRGGGAITLLTAGANPNGAGQPEFDASTPPVVLADGTVLFSSADRLVAADTDSQSDLYLARPDGTLTNLSAVQTGAGGVSAAPSHVVVSGDGTTVAFNTAEQLLAEDTSANTVDVYKFKLGGSLELVTTGDFQGTAVGLSPDGARTYWESNLVQGAFANNDGGLSDLFYRDGTSGSVSSPTYGYATGPSLSPTYAGQSPDGAAVYLRTDEKFDAGDVLNGSPDLYAFANSTVKLLTGGSSPSTTSSNPQLLKACNNGVVVLSTEKSLVSSDTDGGKVDLYLLSGIGTGSTGTVLLSRSATGDDADAVPVAVSATCTQAVWQTTAKVTADDTDGAADLYFSDYGTPTLISPGDGAPVGSPNLTDAVTTLGSTFAFNTTTAYDPADADGGASDVYLFDTAAKRRTLLTTAQPTLAADQTIDAISADGTSPLIETTGALAAADADTALDLYRYVPAPPVAEPGPGISLPGPTPTPSPIPTQLAKPIAVLQIGKGKLKVTLKKGVATITTPALVNCPAGAKRCSVAVTIKQGKKTFQKATQQIASGKSGSVTVKLSASAYKKLRTAKKLKLSVAIVVTQTGAKPVSGTIAASTVTAPKVTKQ